MSEIPWYRNRDVQEAIRNLIIAILLVVLALLGYDVGVAQPRLERALAGQRALVGQRTGSVGSAGTTPYQSPDESDTCTCGTFTYCVDGGPCLEVRVRQ